MDLFQTIILILNILSCIGMASAQRACGAAINEDCENVQPCFDQQSAPTDTCFRPCDEDDDCSEGESCRTMGICRSRSSDFMVCRYGCDVCEDDGVRFVCMCYDDYCPDAEDEDGYNYRCRDVTMSKCVGSSYGHPSFEDDNAYSLSSSSFLCLSAYSQVRVLDKEGYNNTYLKDVERGDRVLVLESESESTAASFADFFPSSNDEYQEVYGFGHRNVYAVATFLQLTTTTTTSVNDDNQEDEKQPLEVTGEHLIMKQKSSTDGGDGFVFVRADSIKVGDFLIGTNERRDMVTRISSVRRPGLYTPLTKDGTMFVNGVQVSSYSSVQEGHNYARFFLVGTKIEVPLSHHLLSHAAVAPFRVLCLFGGRRTRRFVCEQWNAEGQVLFVAMGEHWIRKQSVVVPLVQIVLVPLLSLVMVCFYVTEQFFGGFVVLYVFPPICLLLVSGFLSISFLNNKKRRWLNYNT